MRRSLSPFRRLRVLLTYLLWGHSWSTHTVHRHNHTKYLQCIQYSISQSLAQQELQLQADIVEVQGPPPATQPLAPRSSPGSHAPPERVRAVVSPCVLTARAVAEQAAVLRRPARRDESRGAAAPLQPRGEGVVERAQLGVLS